MTCAIAIPDAEITIAVLGADTSAVATQAAAIAGVKSVLRIDRAENQHPLARHIRPRNSPRLRPTTPTCWALPTSFGKDLMPRVAALLGAPQVSDLMAVDGPFKFRRADLCRQPPSLRSRLTRRRS